MGLFAVSWLFRLGEDAWHPNAAALVFGFAGVALAVVTGWMGGELVGRLSVGVDEVPKLDAPSSLTHRATSARRVA